MKAVLKFSKSNYRIVILLFILIIVIPPLLYKYRSTLLAINPAGGKEMNLTISEKIPYYLQADEKWRNDRIGGSNQRMAGVGCTICCLSMALTHHGFAIDPQQLNQNLKANNGYTNKGWLIWGSIKKITNNRYDVVVPKWFSYSTIDQELEAGNPVISQIFLQDTVQHWVLIVGKSGSEYLVHDPLRRDKKILKLSDLSDKIRSIRFLKANKPSE
ncbi:MAG: hypothetical protein CVV64_18595 [Candidatus Wallbacteria bacterium HGW-Wallbacteria-1]|jgi:hypothetical protein|uniref:Peptidase C39-like domain-containing protein n=1 Tax=Candidatus Wallbacteria bacterium HGW-Wallbacteria-1 TaxID=2013854 RepID=A0A2N1PJF4_9BACT|nr:MAG: hypothetical protein CVV64_18595 [Candidatus Wallbacteria bacterium HGW-Wallbacteria-1]